MPDLIRRRIAIAALAASVGLAGCATHINTSVAAAPAGPVKAAYHVNGDVEIAANALRNIRNHMSADPTAKIAVVTHGPGINFLLAGAQDKNGNAFAPMVDDLALKGVEFKVCNNTLTSRNIDKSKVISGAVIVPSGVAEITRLQAQDGYVYIKP